MSASGILLVVTLVGLALITGLLYSYSCSVNPGLARLNDKSYLEAMQHINRAILNPAFFFSFLGSLLLLPVCSFLYWYEAVDIRLLLYATGLYSIGVFGVTAFGNLPLNRSLDTIDLDNISEEKIIIARQRFEASWNRYHRIRTLCAIVSFILVAVFAIQIA